MFLKERESGHLLAVENTNDLFDPYKNELMGRGQCGEEEQEPELYRKDGLVFLSDEELPKCWLDPHYRDSRVMQKLVAASGAESLQSDMHPSRR